MRPRILLSTALLAVTFLLTTALPSTAVTAPPEPLPPRVTDITAYPAGKVLTSTGVQSLYGPFRIINTQRYSCLTDPAGSMTPGQRLILWNCSGGEDQYWFVRTEDGPASRIINDHSSQCIGVEEVRNNGSWLVQRQCSGALDQYWDTPEPKGDRYGAFRNYQSGQYFSLGNVAGRDGVPVVQNYGCACPDQNWYFSY